MKTRIVYPQLWLDEKFANCKQETKLFFMYLITNQSLGLSRYTRLSDRRISFDTGLNTVQINDAKKELEELSWCFFKEEWIYHKHDCAYVDYVRNQRVEAAKEKEINSVPQEIIEYFNDFCLNKVKTNIKQSLNINHKSKIINQKQETTVPRTGPKYLQELAALTEDVLVEISDKYQVSLSFVTSKKDDLENWVEEKPSRGRGRNFKRTLMKWVKKALDDDQVKKQVKFEKPVVPAISEEVRAANMETLKEIRQRFGRIA